MKHILLILFTALSFSAIGQTVPMTNNVPWYEYSKKLSVGKFMLKSSGEYDTSFTIPSNTASITLDTISADKTVTFTDGASTDRGVTMWIQNSNNSAFIWNVAGNVKEADGTVISNLPRGLHIFYWNSNAWIRLSTSGGSSPTVDTLTFSSPLVQLDKNVSLDFDAFPQDTVGVVEHNDSLFNILYSHTGVRDSTFIVLLTAGGGGSGRNIYNMDSTLSSNRTVTMANRSLLFTATGNGPTISSGAIGLGITTTGTDAIFYGTNERAATNTAVETFTTKRTTSGTPAAGIGQFWGQQGANTSGTTYYTGKFKSWFTDVGAGTEKSKLAFTGLHNGVESDWLTLGNNGAVQLNSYGAGAKTGTAAYTLQVDASGNVIEGSVSGGGNTNSNIGSGFRWAVPNTNNIKTKFDGWGITTDSATNANGLTSKVDSATVLAAARNSLAAVARNGDYGSLSNTPSTNPGVYFSPAESFNTDFIVFASAIVAPTIAFSAGATITWGIPTSASLHNSSFFLSAYGHPSSKRLIIKYPRVKNVINGTVTPDEAFASSLSFMGPSVAVDSMQIQVNRSMPVGGIKLTGAGTSTWTKSGTYASSYDVQNYSTGSGVNITQSAGFIWGTSYEGLTFSYVGTNAYRVRRAFSGLGAYNSKFILVNDTTNADVTTNPTSSDIVMVGGVTGMTTQAVPMDIFVNGTNDFLTPSVNFWVFGVFEVYMTAKGVSSSSVRVAWQNYSGASSYKIYRATDAAFTSPTLIYSGTANSFIDTGLSAATLYHYKMVAVIASVDTEITTFRATTY